MKTIMYIFVVLALLIGPAYGIITIPNGSDDEIVGYTMGLLTSETTGYSAIVGVGDSKLIMSLAQFHHAPGSIYTESNIEDFDVIARKVMNEYPGKIDAACITICRNNMSDIEVLRIGKNATDALISSP